MLTEIRSTAISSHWTQNCDYNDELGLRTCGWANWAVALNYRLIRSSLNLLAASKRLPLGGIYCTCNRSGNSKRNSFRTPKHGCKAVGISLISFVWKRRYMHLRFSGRHLAFSTSGLIAEYSQKFQWTAGPQKQVQPLKFCWYCVWKRSSILIIWKILQFSVLRQS